jgi:hypothetical protein
MNWDENGITTFYIGIMPKKNDRCWSYHSKQHYWFNNHQYCAVWFIIQCGYRIAFVILVKRYY